MLNLLDFVVADTETTGFDTDKAMLCDVAIVCYQTSYISSEVDPPRVVFESLVNPEMPIPIDAMAVHHITDEQVKDAPPAYAVAHNIAAYLYGKTIVCHNADYDSKIMRRLLSVPTTTDFLCTWRLASKLWPDAPGYKNQELRYWRKYIIDLGGRSPHRAAPDAIVTAYIFRELFGIFTAGFKQQTGKDPSIEDLLRFERQPIKISKMPFGKHKGMPMDEVPYDYLMWMIRKIPDLSPDLKWTVENMLKSRRG